MRIGFYAPCNEHNRQAGPLLGIAYIASHLREQLGIEDIYLEVDPKRFIERKPDIIAISAFSEKYNQIVRDAAVFKQVYPDVPIILGGPHISALPHSLNPLIDIGVIGEGEKPMAAITKLVQARELHPDNLRAIQNLVFWNETGQTERTLFEDRIKDLDALPLPDRDMMRAWWPNLNHEVRFDGGIYTSRGCSFRCHFCMYSERANLIRYVSVERVMEDIVDILRRYPEQRRIIFYDDLFVTKKSRLKALADAIRSEGIHKRVSFGCMAKTSFFDEEFCQILKSMNMRVISWGFESGANRVLQYLKDRSSTAKKHQVAVDLCNRYGIHAGGYFIVGSSLETQEDLAKTYWFIRNNLPRMPLISVFPIIPLPGTALWTEAATRGLVDDSFSRWDDLGFLRLEPDTYIHLNEHYTLPELKAAYDQQFNPLMRWTTWIYQLVNEYQEQLDQYYPEVIEGIRNAFPAQSRLLEVHRGDRPVSFALEDDYQLTSLHWSELETLASDASFDGVVLTHSLEKFGLNSWQWEKIKALNCPIYLVVTNAGHLTNLMSLLQGKFPHPLEHLEQYQQNYRYTLHSLQAALTGPDLRVVRTGGHRLPADYSEPLRQLQQWLGSYLPMDTLLQEAETYSYSLLLQHARRPALR